MASGSGLRSVLEPCGPGLASGRMVSVKAFHFSHVQGLGTSDASGRQWWQETMAALG